jgi:cytochrome c2
MPGQSNFGFRVFGSPPANLIRRLAVAAVAAGLLSIAYGEPALAAGDPASDGLGGGELLVAIAEADVAAGAAFAVQCQICHTLGEEEGHGIGPNLFDVVGEPVGAADGYAYSEALLALNAAGAVWDFDRLNAFLENPRDAVPGTKMGFVGITDAEDRVNVLAFLRSLSNVPVAFAPAGDAGGIGLLEPLTFTAAQVESGRAWYHRAGCVDCHGLTLHGVVDTREDGEGDGPALVGPRFAATWFGGNALDLYQLVQETMPLDRPREEATLIYADLLAFILAENGFAAGAINFPTDAATLAQMGFYQ